MKKSALLLWGVLPFLALWVAWHERVIRRRGERLPPEALADAAMVGVQKPDQIRILRVEKIPVLNGRFIRALSKFYPAITPHTVGLCLRYGIYIHEGFQQTEIRRLLAHECVHTAQYEKHGILRFLYRYFSECLRHGYRAAPMELEAITLAGRLYPHS